MRHSFIAITAAVAVALVAAPGHASGFRINTDTCKHDYSTEYDVDVTPAGISYHRKVGSPAQVFIHDGAIRVDGKDIGVSPADTAALRRYEDNVRRLFPEVAAVAREGIQVGFAAMTTVTLSFAEGDQRAAMLDKLKRKQAEALRAIDQGVGAGHFSSDRMAETVAGSVSDNVGELVGSVTSSAVAAALSGDSTRIAALQERAATLEKSLDREMAKRSKALDDRANLICPRLNELADIQQGWSIGLPGGKSLALMTIRPKGSSGNDEKGHGDPAVSF